MTASAEERLAALRLLHRKQVTNYRSEGRREFCAHCATGDPFVTVSEEWPCPTRRVVDGDVSSVEVEVEPGREVDEDDDGDEW